MKKDEISNSFQYSENRKYFIEILDRTKMKFHFYYVKIKNT